MKFNADDMNLYLIRHAEAEQTSALKPHEERELTPQGIEILKASAEIWKNYFSEIDIILSSPLKRAMQTAVIVKDYFKIKTEVLEEVSLMNGGLTEDLLNIISNLGVENVVMVGHQPDLGIHISKMTTPSALNVVLPPAAIVKIYFNGNPEVRRGKLEFLIPPVNKKG